MESLRMRDVQRLCYDQALEACGALEVLAPFDPRVAGMPPLGLDLPDSDIDVLCCTHDPRAFADVVWRSFRGMSGFTIKQWMDPPSAVIATFQASGWRIELYGEAIPVERQRGWRHFEVERRLLDLGGAVLRAAVLNLRRRGMKTEPAFAAVLGLTGDPYVALLDLYEHDDSVLAIMLRSASFDSAAVAFQ